MANSETPHDEAIDLLRRDARRGRAGAAQALERALRRQEKDEVYLKGREARAEKKRNATTSRFLREAADATDEADSWGPAIPHDLWVKHNAGEACRCLGCWAYARDVLLEILQ